MVLPWVYYDASIVDFQSLICWSAVVRFNFRFVQDQLPIRLQDEIGDMDSSSISFLSKWLLLVRQPCTPATLIEREDGLVLEDWDMLLLSGTKVQGEWFHCDIVIFTNIPGIV